MSNNAVASYDAGLLPASKLAPIINSRFGVKINAVWIKARLRYEEKHHTSSKFNLTEFYSVEDVVAEIGSDAALLESARDFTLAAKCCDRSEYIADVTITEWERVSINRFGKLAWQRSVRTIAGVAVKPVGAQFVEIAGEGRKALKNLVINKLDASEINRRRRVAAGHKAAATRKLRAAKLALALEIKSWATMRSPLLLAFKSESTLAAERAARAERLGSKSMSELLSLGSRNQVFKFLGKKYSGYAPELWTGDERAALEALRRNS